MRQEDEQVRRLLKTRVIRLNEMVTGVTVGTIAGVILFLATNILVLKGLNGSEPVGPHLGLLSQFFLGYSVTFVGSFVGFVYALITGTLLGYCGAKVYNWIAGRNDRGTGSTGQQ